MIQKVSNALTKWLLKKGAISYEEKELYQYAVFSFLFSFSPLFIVMIFGLLFDAIPEGILMILPFVLVRKFSGGFHLKSPGLCFVITSVMLCAFVLFVKRNLSETGQVVHMAAVVIMAVQIFLVSPMDTEARKLTGTEICTFRKVARILVICFFTAFLILSFLGMSHWAVPIGTGIILSGILQIPALFQKIFSRDRSGGKNDHSRIRR